MYKVIPLLFLLLKYLFSEQRLENYESIFLIVFIFLQRIDAFELWCWRRPLRVPWTARRSNQSTLKEISPECSLEGLMLKLKLQKFDYLMRRADSFEKILMMGKIEGRRRRGRQRIRWLDGITNSMDVSLSKPLGVGDGQGSLTYCSPWGS